MIVLAALALFLTPQATDPNLPRIILTGKTGVVWDTPIRKLGVLGDQYSQRLVQYQPGTERILKSVPLIAGGGGDGSTSLLGNPDLGPIAVQAVSAGMSLEIYRAEIFNKDLQKLPVDAAYVYGLDQTGILVAPDLNRYRDARQSFVGPLTFYDPQTSKMLWRRYDISGVQETYQAVLYPNYVGVTSGGYVEVLDRKTGNTVYSDPPRFIQAGEMTVDLSGTPRPDLTHDQHQFVSGLPTTSPSRPAKNQNFINTPLHHVTIEGDQNGGYTIIERDRATDEVIGTALLDARFKEAYPILVNPLDSPIFALNILQYNSGDPHPKTALVFRNGQPPLKLPDVQILRLDPTVCFALRENHLLKIDPQTGKTLWSTPEIGESPIVESNERSVFIFHTLKNQPTLTAVSFETGRVVWERQVTAGNIRLKRNYLILFQKPTNQVLDLTNGRTLATFTLKPGVIPDRYKD